MGKYDKEMEDELSSSGDLVEETEFPLTNYFLCFTSLRKIFFSEFCIDKQSFVKELKESKEIGVDFLNFLNNKNSTMYANIQTLVKSMMHSVQTILCRLFELNVNEIAKKCYSLYKEKNNQYGDAWFVNGYFGVFYDLHRKSARLYEIALNCKNHHCILSSQGSLMDTLIDTVNYCAMLRIALQSDSIRLFDAVDENIFSVDNFNDVDI